MLGRTHEWNATMKTTDRDEALLLTAVAKALCAEYFRSQIELAARGNTALYNAKVAGNWHHWIPQAQAVVDASVRSNTNSPTAEPD